MPRFSYNTRNRSRQLLRHPIRNERQRFRPARGRRALQMPGLMLRHVTVPGERPATQQRAAPSATAWSPSPAPAPAFPKLSTGSGVEEVPPRSATASELHCPRHSHVVMDHEPAKPPKPTSAVSISKHLNDSGC
ncbi:hypothetical protein CCHR01_11207 [Colletotrichum chrysophilum]|uniref:Uncharacterized protein n=1 Tax=Colletotrichum chrysophilum TaxID=1836956 RepID=A0AAD9EG01_9PEZI|nr:hypothetical protein CCHR01_11207 [Colletotrichum chrysophilum]